MVVAPPALALKPHNSVLPHKPLAPPMLLSLYQSQSERLRTSESVHEPFKEISEFPAAFHLTQMVRIPTDFVGTYLSSTVTLGWGALVWGWEPMLLWGDHCSQEFLPMPDHHTLVQGHSISCLCPSYQSQHDLFFIALVIGLLSS